MMMFLKHSKSLALMAMTIIAAASLSLVSCSDNGGNKTVKPNEKPTYKTPKYIFFFIGDGMATAQISLTEAALDDLVFNNAEMGKAGPGEMHIRQFPVAGMSTTHAEDRYITGSAASATALATGHKTTINTISKTGDRSQNLMTIAEMARDKGMKVGIVSSVSIDHATPACFYAHEDTRKNINSIAAQMATSNFDYFGGGGAAGEGGTVNIAQTMNQAGYQIVTEKSAFLNLQPGNKIWSYNSVLDKSAALWYEIDRPESHISLAEFTKKGIEFLDNDKGFFMMVEGGKIDWACHANDAVSAAFDMIAFDQAIAEAIEFYNQHPDETLIVVTGDHECGGLSLGFAATGYKTAFDILKYQKISYDLFTSKVQGWKEAANVDFEMALDSMKYYFGLGDSSKQADLAISEYEKSRLEDGYNKSMTGKSIYNDEEIAVIYGYYDPFTVTITHLLNNKAGIDWTSYSHTGVPVPVFAMGQGQYEFSGYYDNTDIAKKIIEIGKLNK
ncbi:MAG: alkaline phosphatase [Candidatus Kapaibacterium sp.]